LGELLATAVQRQSMADVPLGILLSGGVDSSIVAAIAAKQSNRPIRTFTVRFGDDARLDEGPFARLVAAHVGSEHTELKAQPADESLLRKLVAQFDDPIADSSMIPTYLVSQEIRKHATVALGGDGGDELFGGYSRYSTHLRQEQLRRAIPRQLRRQAAWAARKLLPEGVAGLGFLSALAGDAGASLANAGRIFRDDERIRLSSSLSALSTQDRIRPERERMDFWLATASVLQRATALDFSTYLPDDVLLKVDRASMLTSLEVRAPFLDVNVIDFAFSQLVDEHRATIADRKIILRSLGKSMLPATLDLTRKQGFSIPVDTWMRGPWKAIIAELIDDQSQSLVSSDALARYNHLLLNGRSVGGRLYALMFLRLWERHYNITDVV
jgi:asparagine synthase (glutamine-hydrolysing)